MIPPVCRIFAGVFSRVLRESGLADGIAGSAASFGVDGTVFAIITFIPAAIFATDVMPFVFYSYIMLAVMVVTPVFGIGRDDYPDKLSPERRRESEERS